ncbi:MAG: sulfate permease [Hyphomicrobiaceae bacterium]
MPFKAMLAGYKREWITGDVTAGVVVAILLIPQAMAYALLVGLPASAGLYASLLPPLLYAAFGTSRVLAVGPTAILSLMVASALQPLAPIGTPEYMGLALTLSLMCAVLCLILGALRAGSLVNFMSHPVIAGFMSASGIIIIFSQLKHVLGLDVPVTESIPTIVKHVALGLANTNLIALAIAAFTLLVLLLRVQIATALSRLWRRAGPYLMHLPKAMPLVVAVIGILVAWGFALAETAGLKVVGEIPRGLPSVTWPSIDLATMERLLPAAILIVLVGFIESVSVGKSLAGARRQTIEPNRELVGLGLANAGAAFTGGYPVTGSFSRSVVNFASGANTLVSSLVTLSIVLVALLFLTPLLFHLPQAVLASIIMVAVLGLIDFGVLRRAWAFSKADGFSYLVTFVAVLGLGVVKGIVCGIIVSLVLHLWRTSRPHIAIVGRIGTSEIFRSVQRYETTTYDGLLLLRIDESLYFANAAFLEDNVLRIVAKQPDIKDVVIICTSVNVIDASALETLERLIERLRAGGVTLHLAAVKLMVYERLQRTHFLSRLSPGQVFLSTHDAVVALAGARPAPGLAG